jgi:hypothetical protein
MNGLMYLIRIAIAAVIALFVVLLMKKKRRLALFISIVTVVLLVLSILFPVELFFVRFKTPTDAQSYAYFNNDIIDVVYGEESAFILSKDSDHGADYAYSVIQKDAKGYMIPVFGSEDVVHRIGMISIVRLKNTNDYYFFGLDKETGEYLSSLSNVYESHTIPVKSEGYVYCYGRCGLSGTQGDGTQD